MNSVASKVTKKLQPLIGLKLSVARLAATMRGFHFGETRATLQGTAGEYTLHIQCTWRIEGPDGIYTGDMDLWRPNTVAAGLKQPKWTYEDGNLQDERLAFLLKGCDPQTRSFINETENLVVENIEADAYGGLSISLSGGYRLVLFPSGTVGENWRFFSRDTEAPHFVIRGGKVEERS